MEIINGEQAALHHRVGGSWHTTIIREGTGQPDQRGRRPGDALVGVVMNGAVVLSDVELAAEVVAALNAAPLAAATGAELLDELRTRGVLDDDEDGATLVTRIDALRGELDAYTLEARRADYTPDVEHRASSPGGDGLGYGPCVGCGELWPCKESRGAP